jgi:hypothetical protein
MTQSLCHTCTHCKEVISGKGSRFLLCQKSTEDRRFPKYPPQPVVRCAGFDQTGPPQSPPT